MPAERAHYFTMNLLSIADKIGVLSLFLEQQKPENAIDFCGLHFPNKIGLAAGFDKDARFLNVLSKMGFGHVEVGTVTPLPQAGNPKPRLFRLPKDQALINRMGFNNNGVDAMVKRLKNRPKNLIVGGNIGKNKLTEDAIPDYLICLEKLYDYVDYFTINISSPNTPGLRDLQDKGPLLALLAAVIEKRDFLKSQKGIDRPVFLKIAPDLTETQIVEIAEIVIKTNTNAVVVSNTTIDRTNLKTSSNTIEEIGAGGLSGLPLRDKSNVALLTLSNLLPKNIGIIAVGGIMCKQDAQDKINMGAHLVQVYTGFVYQGLPLINKLANI